MPLRGEFDRPRNLIVEVALGLSAFVVCRQVIQDMLAGGNFFRQGDYLINSLNEPVRRGLFGSGIIWLSDLTEVNVIHLVGMAQILLVLVLYTSFRQALIAMRQPQLATLLATSPAIFIMFWLADSPGSLRKELLAYAGLSLVAVATLKQRTYLLWAGSLIFSIGMIAHEALILFLPTFFALLYFSTLRDKGRVHVILSALLVTLGALYSTRYTILHLRVSDFNTVCSPLLARGLTQEFCQGAILWVQQGISGGVTEVLSRLGPRSISGFVIGYVAALAPFLYLAQRMARPVYAGLAMFAAALPFVPLYFVAIDWGRWMSLHIFSLTIVLVTAFGLGHLKLTAPIPKWQVFCFVTMGALMSPRHVIGFTYGDRFISVLSYLGQGITYVFPTLAAAL